jgi:hypothetical protein
MTKLNTELSEFWELQKPTVNVEKEVKEDSIYFQTDAIQIHDKIKVIGTGLIFNHNIFQFIYLGLDIEFFEKMTDVKEFTFITTNGNFTLPRDKLSSFGVHNASTFMNMGTIQLNHWQIKKFEYRISGISFKLDGEKYFFDINHQSMFTIGILLKTIDEAIDEYFNQ